MKRVFVLILYVLVLQCVQGHRNGKKKFQYNNHFRGVIGQESKFQASAVEQKHKTRSLLSQLLNAKPFNPNNDQDTLTPLETTDQPAPYYHFGNNLDRLKKDPSMLYPSGTTEQSVPNDWNNWDNYEDLDSTNDDPDMFYQSQTTTEPTTEDSLWDNYDDLEDNVNDDFLETTTTFVTMDPEWDVFKTNAPFPSLPSDLPGVDYDSCCDDNSDSQKASNTGVFVGGISGGVIVLLIFLRVSVWACRVHNYSRLRNTSAVTTVPTRVQPQPTPRRSPLRSVGIVVIVESVKRSIAPKTGEQSKPLITPENV